MSESQELQSANSDSNIEVLEEGSESEASIPPIQQQILNTQNNFHFTQNIDLEKVANLNSVSPDLADRVMTIYEKQFEHAKEIDKSILEIEKTEQQSRITERPFQRKFAFRSINYALIISIASLVFAGYCATVGQPWLAAIGISVPISVAVANMLGQKTAKQNKIENKGEKEESTSED